jgi:L-aspartate oxidase
MGGVLTDVDGHTTLPGLYAAGEVACTGVHGANRLASNSLLEGLVFGTLAADAMITDTAGQPIAIDSAPQVASSAAGNTSEADTERWIEDLRSNMWRYAGLLRDSSGLETMQEKLAALAATMPRGVTRRAIEARNLHTVASIIVASALARQESRGAHYRNDYPERDPIARHSIMRHGEVTLELQSSPTVAA